MRAQALFVVLAISSAGCGKDGGKPSAASGSGSGSAAPAVTGSVQIFVDDQQVGTLANEQLSMWPRLDTLIPMAARRLGTWQAIKLAGAGKPVEIAQPSATHPELVAALFPGDNGAAFGMFDPVELANKGKPALREDAITEVRIVLAKGTGRGENDHHGDGGGGDPTQLKLAIKAKKGEPVVVEGSKLLAIDREAPPGDADGKAGWKLSTLLAQAGVTTYKRLLLTDAKGTNLTLEQQDLDPATAVPFVKLNRQGSLRFRVFRKQGDTWQPTSDLRGLASIEVLE